MTPDDFDELTCRIPFETNKELVFGAPRPRRPRFPARLVFVVAVLGASVGCATGRPATADQPESVGTLAPSYASIAVAPLKHGAPPELGQVVGSDDDSRGGRHDDGSHGGRRR